MPYKDKVKDRQWHRDHMRNKRSVTPVTPAVTPKQEKLAQLRALISNPDVTQSNSSPTEEESNTRLPLYNKRVHKPGDRVLAMAHKDLFSRWYEGINP